MCSICLTWRIGINSQSFFLFPVSIYYQIWKLFPFTKFGSYFHLPNLEVISNYHICKLFPARRHGRILLVSARFQNLVMLSNFGRFVRFCQYRKYFPILPIFDSVSNIRQRFQYSTAFPIFDSVSNSFQNWECRIMSNPFLEIIYKNGKWEYPPKLEMSKNVEYPRNNSVTLM